MAAEEFFMYLTIALVFIIPITVRVHRYLTRDRTAKMLREQFGQPSTQEGRHDQQP